MIILLGQKTKRIFFRLNMALVGPRRAKRHKRSLRPRGHLKTAKKSGTLSRIVKYLHKSHSAHHHHHHISWVSAVIAAGIFGLLPVDVMHLNLFVAQATKGYEGTTTQPSVSVDVAPGGQSAVILTFKNTGTLTWHNGGVNDYVSLYLVGETSSPVGCSNWRHKDSPSLITDMAVAPGKSTTVKFKVCGNKSGTYTETLRLAAENTAWMKTSDVKLTVHVKTGSVSTPSSSSTSGSTTTPAPTSSAPSTATQAGAPVTSGRSAMLLLRSAQQLTLTGSQRVQFTVGFKNTGTTIWTSRSLAVASMYPAMNDDPNTQMYDDTWTSRGEPVRVDSVTNPGEIGFLSFWMKAPARKGAYRITLALEADNQSVDGGMIDIPVTVTADGNIVTNPSPAPVPTGSSSNPSTPIVIGANGIPQSPDHFQSTEPIIRVGIFATTDDQMVVTAPGPFRVQQNGNAVCSFTSGQQVTIRFDRANKVYKATGPGCTSQSTDYYQVQRTDDPLGPLTMADFSRLVSWLPGANDNTFRSILELRYSPTTDAVWTINQLPMEYYLKGMAETSDVSPMEFQKALLTAARTYAFYLWMHNTKHDDEFYTVDAKYDQVYRGYGAEARSPNIVAAVDQTRGQMVTYNGQYAITPYFSRSDGHTRNWTDVWGGTGYPWCVSVQVPEDAGKTLWGHGVGMSASGALGMANEGVLYQDILKHFYVGTSLMTFY